MSELNPSLPVTIDDIHAAARLIGAEAVRTPLVSHPLLDEMTGGRVLLKCENLQRTGSFKFRGAYNAIAALSQEQRDRGIVAVSSGNHAQGVAEAGRLFGASTTIFMPSDAPKIKLERTARSGARVVTQPRKDREAALAAFLGEHGGTLVHAYNDAKVIAGQGTAGLEIIEDCQARGIVPDVVMVPCGGGGLSAGVGLAVRSSFPDVNVFLSEPVGYDDYAQSLERGVPVPNTQPGGSVIDALLAASPGEIGFAINRHNKARAVAVSNADALGAVAFAFRELKMVLEPGGAAALAALLRGLVDSRGKTIVVVLSGGNIDPARLQDALDNSLH